MKVDPFNFSYDKTKLNFMSEDTIKNAASPIRLQLPEEFAFVRKKLEGHAANLWWFTENPALGDFAPAHILFFAPHGQSKLRQWFKAVMAGKDPWMRFREKGQKLQAEVIEGEDKSPTL